MAVRAVELAPLILGEKDREVAGFVDGGISDADNLHRRPIEAGGHFDFSADVEVAEFGGGGVDDHLTWCFRRVPLGNRDLVAHRFGRWIVGKTHRWRTIGLNRLAVGSRGRNAVVGIANVEGSDPGEAFDFLRGFFGESTGIVSWGRHHHVDTVISGTHCALKGLVQR